MASLLPYVVFIHWRRIYFSHGTFCLILVVLLLIFFLPSYAAIILRYNIFSNMQLVNGEQMPGRTLQTTSVGKCFDMCHKRTGEEKCAIFEFNSDRKQCMGYSRSTSREKRTSSGTNIYVQRGFSSCKIKFFLLSSNMAETFVVSKIYFKTIDWKITTYMFTNN